MDCEAYRDQMLDLLYGEAGDASRRAVEEHQGRCPSCRDEMAAFKRLRRDLQAWNVPAPARPRRAVPWGPGLAAAAGLLLALGTVAGIQGGELRRDERGWSLRLGRPAPAAGDLQARFEEQEKRHRAEMQELRASLAAPAPADRQAVLSAAQELVRLSEQRQEARLHEALARLGEHYEAQRRYDMAQVSAGMSYLEGKAGLHAARTTELVGEVLMAAQEK